MFSFPAASTFPYGTDVIVEAVPALGYRFDNWSGDLEGNTKSITVRVGPSKRVQANFVQLIPNWLIAIIATATAVPFLVRWRRRSVKPPLPT
jgi:hypothetical protein